jgi:resuscitation-promoting factor RpfA
VRRFSLSEHRFPEHLSSGRVVGSALLVAGFAVATVTAASPVSASESLKTELHKLRLCESGGNYRENTGNGYYGAYQFSAGTWHGLGYHGRPDRAKSKTQDHAAMKMHKADGWAAWPSCAHSEHLR